MIHTAPWAPDGTVGTRWRAASRRGFWGGSQKGPRSFPGSLGEGRQNAAESPPDASLRWALFCDGATPGKGGLLTCPGLRKVTCEVIPKISEEASAPQGGLLHPGSSLLW